MSISIDGLIQSVRADLEGRPVLEELQAFIRNRASSAGTRPEEVFTREFLCPAVGRYFYEVVRQELQLSESEIEKGLGTEGYQNCPGFGFTPARSRKQLFTKMDIIKSAPPESWLDDCPKGLSAFQACPDFAIANPLPLSVVGEVKYFNRGSSRAAVKELYDAARQAMFYLGVFQDRYDAALLVIADATPGHAFMEGLKLIKPKLLERFGAESNVYLAPFALR